MTPTGDDDTPDAAADPELELLQQENARLQELVADREHDRSVKRPARRRGVISIALVVIGALLLPVAVFTVWTRNQVLDTDRYVETMAPLASDPTMQSALIDRITNELSSALDIKSLAAESLPERAAILAAPIAAGAETLIRNIATKAIESDQFAALWEEANRAGHEGMVAVLTGAEGTVVSNNNGEVVLRLGPLAERVLQQLDAQFGLDISSKVPAERVNIAFVLVDSSQLADAQSAVRLLDRLAWISVVLAFGCLVGAVFVSKDRRRGLFRAGCGVAISMLVVLIGYNLGREFYLTNLPSVVVRPDAAAVVFDTLTRFVLRAIRLLFVVGILLAIAGWLSGPSKLAVRIRGWWNAALGRGGAGVEGVVPLGPVPGWVKSHLSGLRAALVGLGAIVLVIWERPTGRAVLLVVVLALVAMAILQILAGAASSAEADTGTPTDAETDAAATPLSVDAS